MNLPAVMSRCMSDRTHPARSVCVSVRDCAWSAMRFLRCVWDAASFILSTHTQRGLVGVISILRPRPPGTRHMVLASLKRPRGSRDKSSICAIQSLSFSLSLSFVRWVDHLSPQHLRMRRFKLTAGRQVLHVMIEVTIGLKDLSLLSVFKRKWFVND